MFLGIESYTTRFGAALAACPALGRLFTYGTLALECLGPVLLFSPVRTAQIRSVMVLVFAAFHLAINLTVHIGLFELTSIVAVSSFLPSGFWDRIERRPAARALAARVGAAVGRLFPARPGGHHGRPDFFVHRLAGVTVALSLVLVLYSNLESLRGRTVELVAPVQRLASGLQLLQNWDIFANLGRAPRGWFDLSGSSRMGP